MHWALDGLALLIGLNALLKHLHDVKSLFFKENSLSLEVLIDNFLLLSNDFRLAGNLLQKNLHHIHLAESKRVHLAVHFLALNLVLWWLQVVQELVSGQLIGVDGLPPLEASPHILRVERYKRVLHKLVAFIDFADTHVRDSTTQLSWLMLLVAWLVRCDACFLWMGHVKILFWFKGDRICFHLSAIFVN